MTSQEPTQAEELDEEQRRKEVNSGLIRSIFDDYPGYVQFPHPLMLHHISQWWDKCVKANEGVEPKDFKFHLNQWISYRDMLLDNDGWHIDKITPGEVKQDLLPAEVISFIVMLGEQYVLNQLTPKQRAVLRSLI